LTENLILFDNEPVFHIPYLFNFSSRPDLTQKWVRKIIDDRFKNSAGGMPGNDDLGSMSSWFVFSALGLYPITPGNRLYTISSPLFDKITIHLPEEKRLIISKEKNSNSN